jgi:hypothetical protein
MASLKVDKTLINIAAKKALGKAHTSTLSQTQNESIPSNVQVSAETTFGESVPNTVNIDSFYTILSGTVEYLEFDVSAVIGSSYDEDSYSGYGGSESSDNTEHGYYLKLPSTYVTGSSNSNKNTGFFVNGQRVYDTRGKLQLVPPFLSNAGANLYNLTLYDQTNTRIMPGDSIDWTIDYYNGIVFVQDPSTSKVPTKARAFLYIGKMAGTKITEAAASGGGSDLVVKDEGSTISSAATSINFVGTSVSATNSGNNISVSIGGAIDYSRTEVVTHATSSVTDRVLGVNATASLDIRLPAASGFSAGQYFIIKDEAGNANSNNITVRTAGSDTIDGQTSIILESPYAAVNLYSNGTNKFFVY